MTFFRQVLNILNQNTHGVLFDGERFFQYGDRGEWAVYEKSATKPMAFEKIDFVPMTELPQTETPFVDLNKRSDYMKQFLFAIKVTQQDFEESNPAYLSLLDFAKNYQSETIEADNATYTVKTFEPIREGQPMKLGDYTDWFVLVSLSMSLTKLPVGYTGTMSTLEVSEDGETFYLIDATNHTLPVAVDLEPSRSLTEKSRNKYHTNGKTIEIHADVNHRYTYIDKQLVKALKSHDYTQKFWVRHTEPEEDPMTYECIIKDGTPEYENGIPISYVITFIEGA